MKYKALSNVTVDHITYKGGDIFDLDADIAGELLRALVIEEYHQPFSGVAPTIENPPATDTKIGAAFHTLLSAANDLRDRIREIDLQISTLNGQRKNLIGAKLSKEDYLAYIKADIERRGTQYERNMIGKLKSPVINNFTYLERAESVGNELAIPYLTGDVLPHGEVSASAMCFLFGTLIVQRMGDILNKIEWAGDVLPVAERKQLIAKIDEEANVLQAERNGLTGLLAQSGMAG